MSEPTFDPGPGWRLLRGRDPDLGAEIITQRVFGALSSGRTWVRDEPVPPLPTAPFTVIRVTWRGPHAEATGVRTLTGPMWVSVTGGNALSPRELAERITGFEVLAELRATTAKAVLDRVDDMNRLSPDDMGTLHKEFGVTDA